MTSQPSSRKDAIADPCPCGSGKAYLACCQPFHLGSELPQTAQALMRSRYSAFVKQEIGYLKETTWPARQREFDEAGYHQRAANSVWLSLEILQTSAGNVEDTKGHVTFIARSLVEGNLHEQTEKSLFKKKSGRWYYVKPDG